MAIGYKLSEEQKRHIRELVKEGLTAKVIAERMGISRGTVGMHRREMKKGVVVCGPKEAKL